LKPRGLRPSVLKTQPIGHRWKHLIGRQRHWASAWYWYSN